MAPDRPPLQVIPASVLVQRAAGRAADQGGRLARVPDPPGAETALEKIPALPPSPPAAIPIIDQPQEQHGGEQGRGVNQRENMESGADHGVTSAAGAQTTRKTPR